MTILTTSAGIWPTTSDWERTFTWSIWGPSRNLEARSHSGCESRPLFAAEFGGKPASRLQRGSRAFAGRFRGPARHDHGKQSELSIELDKRRGAPFVGFQADRNRFRPVILPLIQSAAAMVADTLDLWRLRRQMEDGPARPMPR